LREDGACEVTICGVLRHGPFAIECVGTAEACADAGVDRVDPCNRQTVGCLVLLRFVIGGEDIALGIAHVIIVVGDRTCIVGLAYILGHAVACTVVGEGYK